MYLAHTQLLERKKNASYSWLTLSALLLGLTVQSDMKISLFSHTEFPLKKKKETLLLTFVRVQGCLGEDSHFEPQI